MTEAGLDLLVIGAHPDDAEVHVGGLLALASRKGLKAAILDLTVGELGSRGTVETRKAEAIESTRILGVSRDGLKAQENFKAKQGFPFDLLSDTDEALCHACDVIKLKKLYGRESLGIDRSTFLFDPAGRLRREWRGVKVKGHVDEVLAAAQALAADADSS